MSQSVQNKPPKPKGGKYKNAKIARYGAEEDENIPVKLTLQQKFLAGLVLVALAAIVGFLLFQPTRYYDKNDSNEALQTAVAASGFKAPPTPVPGTDISIDFIIYGKRDYIPAQSGETINFVIANKRFRSIYVSQCDGVVLQRFTGTDINDKKQVEGFTNWESIAPGGMPYCGPAGAEAVQVGPGDRADAAFKFDRTQRGATLPYEGKDWNVPGDYRLLVQYYLNCPQNSRKAADCIDKQFYESEYFKIVSPSSIMVGTPEPPAQATPTATPKP
jgi:hypothetical protein